MLHQAFKRSEYLHDVPCFGIDPSYGHEDKDFEYVARQLKDELVPFLEKTTGAKYDFGRVREVVEETNKQYRIWKEVNEQLRASPMPLPSFTVPDVFWALTQHLPAGHGRPRHGPRTGSGKTRGRHQNRVPRLDRVRAHQHQGHERGHLGNLVARPRRTSLQPGRSHRDRHRRSGLQGHFAEQVRARRRLSDERQMLGRHRPVFRSDDPGSGLQLRGTCLGGS